MVQSVVGQLCLCKTGRLGVELERMQLVDSSALGNRWLECKRCLMGPAAIGSWTEEKCPDEVRRLFGGQHVVRGVSDRCWARSPGTGGPRQKMH